MNNLTLIPIKCFGCGTMIADKYQCYLDEVRRQKMSLHGDKDYIKSAKVIYLTNDNSEKTIEAGIMDTLGLIKQCCRKHLLTKV